MAFSRFVPEIWSAIILSALEKSLVYGAPDVVNRDYEGEIADYGDTVKITSISDPTIFDYVANTTTIVPEELTDAQRTILIDQSKAFAFKIDDIDKRQMRGSVLPEAMRRSAYKLRDTADRKIASLYTQVNAANAIAATHIDDGDTAYELLVDLGTRLDEADNGSEGRWCVIPPWYHGLLQKNTNFINAEKAADDGAALRNGFIGRAAGFNLKKSNNVPNPTGDDFIIMAGAGNIGISYAEQISKVEAYRPESSFSDAVKGLHLYGVKMIRPEAVVTLTASKTAV